MMSVVAEIEYVPMRAEDVAAVLAIEQRLQDFPWTRGNFDDSLTSGYDCRLMREASRLLGFAVLTSMLDEAQLLNIGIVPERQREGLGGRFLEHLFDHLRSRGVARIFLEVRPSNVAGLALYRRHGFAQVGVRNDYYPARQGREAALVLAREL